MPRTESTPTRCFIDLPCASVCFTACRMAVLHGLPYGVQTAGDVVAVLLGHEH
jgi:hypothetical protein